MDKIILYDRVNQTEKRLNALPFIFKIGEQIYSKQDLQEWQKKEYLKTAKLLNRLFSAGLTFDKGTPFLTIKKEVIMAKMTIGQEALKSKLSKQYLLANSFSKIGVRTSFNKRKVAIADIYLKNSQLKARQIVATLENMLLNNSEDNQFYNFKANPNHFYTQGSIDEQTVVEMTGGTRIANKFTLMYGNNAGLVTQQNSNFEFEIGGTGNLDSGVAIGGVRHLFTDEDDNTIHARLQVEFPEMLPSFLVQQHAIHLLVEFSNWLTDVDLLVTKS